MKWKLVFLYDDDGEIRQEYLTSDPITSDAQTGS